MYEVKSLKYILISKRITKQSFNDLAIKTQYICKFCDC